MSTVYKFILAGLAAALITLPGCGGGGGGGDSVAGIGGTGRIASGTITGFGSIFVNDFEYEFDAGTSFDVDGDTSASESDLEIGMVVTVVAEDVVGTTATAVSVVFDDEVEGPVADLIDDGTTKRFTVLGTTVVVDAASTVFDDNVVGFDFDSLTDGTNPPGGDADVVEVSGFVDAATGVLNATYIEKQGSFDPTDPEATEAELKGTVEMAPPGGAGVGDTFEVNGVTVTILAGADLSDVNGGLVTDGMFVEAKGVLTSASTMNASKVEQESEGFDEDADDVSLEGLISEFNDISDFKVAGQPVDASSAVFDPVSLQLADGLRVEVEGPIINGTLIAEEVEAEGGGDIKIDASVSATSTINNTITLSLGSGELTVNVDAGTEIEDEDTGDITLAEIVPGNFLEVRAIGDSSSNIIATEIRRSSDTDNDVILQGPLDNFDAAGGSITVLGIQFSTNGSTEYEDEDDNSLPGGASEFDGLVNVGDIVKIKDEDPADTVADEIDVEN